MNTPVMTDGATNPPTCNNGGRRMNRHQGSSNQVTRSQEAATNFQFHLRSAFVNTIPSDLERRKHLQRLLDEAVSILESTCLMISEEQAEAEMRQSSYYGLLQ